MPVLEKKFTFFGTFFLWMVKKMDEVPFKLKTGKKLKAEWFKSVKLLHFHPI